MDGMAGLLLLLLLFLLLFLKLFFCGFQGDHDIIQLVVRDGGTDMEDGGADFVRADFFDRSDIDAVKTFGIVAQRAGIDFVSDLDGIGRRLRRMAQDEIARRDADGWA